MHNTGYDGFLGTRASLMLDVVLLAMFAVIPVLFWSIWLVKCRRNYTLHRRVQLLLGTALLVVVALFEIDVRVYGWTHRAAESRYYGSWVRPVLYVHLVFAISTTVLWILVTVRALRRDGRDVVVLDSLELGHRAAVLDAPLVVGDIADRDLVSSLCRDHGVTGVVHFAAYKSVGESMHSPGKYWSNNVGKSAALFDTLAEIGRAHV